MNIEEMKDRIARAEEIQRYTENRCEALEKENAELKKQQFSLRNERNTFLAQNEQYEKELIDFNQKNNELQKENTELKLKLKALDGQIPWKDIKDKSEVIGKLTEAKDLLRRWVNLVGFKCKELTRDTEQFLNEVSE